jgi:PTS system ascorbate-specific IIA component
MEEQQVIEKMMVRDLIQLNVQASDWRDAIRKSANPLLVEGDITKNYVDQIIASVEKYGPYFVIAPHVALAHAPSKAGAERMALGLTTLGTPVDFHNEGNDPVKYVFTLSTTDPNSHLDAMKELVGFLSDDHFYEVMDRAVDPHEILDYIKNANALQQ